MYVSYVNIYSFIISDISIKSQKKKFSMWKLKFMETLLKAVWQTHNMTYVLSIDIASGNYKKASEEYYVHSWIK